MEHVRYIFKVVHGSCPCQREKIKVKFIQPCGQCFELDKMIALGNTIYDSFNSALIFTIWNWFCPIKSDSYV